VFTLGASGLTGAPASTIWKPARVRSATFFRSNDRSYPVTPAAISVTFLVLKSYTFSLKAGWDGPPAASPSSSSGAR